MGVIHLLKHAQVSVEAEVPASLSPLGWQQARRLGASMAESRVVPDLVASGTRVRHRETVAAMTDGAEVDVLEDEGWNDFDHLGVLDRQEPDFDGEPTREQFQHWFEQACRRWSSGLHDDDYDETFTDFVGRVASAKLALVSRMSPESVAVVVSCGGPIAWITTALWAGWTPGAPAAPHAQAWCRAIAVMVNTSVTKIALTPRGMSLVSFNDHTHLERASRTYR